jgi:hypothetical protein
MRGTGIEVYLPELYSLFNVCMGIRPAFEIAWVNTTRVESFNCAGYLFRPELVQFGVTSRNFGQHKVQLAKQGTVLWKRSRKC